MVTQASVKFCVSCGTDHIGQVPCGLSYRDRLRSVTLDPSCTPTREKHNYYDQESLSTVFGEDAEEQMMEETHGVGAYTAEDRKNYPGIESFYTDLGPDSEEG